MARIARNVPVTAQIWETGRVTSQGGRGNLPPGGGRSGHRRVARPSSLPAPPPNALFAEMLRASRELLAVRSPDLEEVIGEGLVAYAGQHASPAALALLSGIACLGTPRQAAAAECAALGLIERGIKRPGWAQHVGAVAAGDCYLNSDAFGDRDEAVCLFSYAGTEPHALVLVVDYNSAGMLSDGWVTSQVDTLLERCRDGSGRGTFRQVAASQARHLLETALGVTHAAPDPRVSKTFASYHAFIRFRIRALPPPDKASPARLHAGGPAARPAIHEPESAWDGAQARRQAWSSDRRAMLVVGFLASDEAEDL